MTPVDVLIWLGLLVLTLILAGAAILVGSALTWAIREHERQHKPPSRDATRDTSG